MYIHAVIKFFVFVFFLLYIIPRSLEGKVVTQSLEGGGGGQSDPHSTFRHNSPD